MARDAEPDELMPELAGDVTGEPSDFSHGSTLQVNSGVVATDGRFHDQVIDAVRTVLG